MAPKKQPPPEVESANRVLTIFEAALNHAFRDGKTPIGFRLA